MNTFVHWEVDSTGVRHAVLELNAEAEAFCAVPLPDDHTAAGDRTATKTCPTCFLITTVRTYNLAAH